MKLRFCALLCVLFSLPASAGWFSYTPYGKSFYSDMHPNFFRFDVSAHSNNPEYDFAKTGKAYRSQTLCVMGADLPIWTGNFADNRFSLSVTLALSTNIWLDLFEKKTAPVVNTDYRISLPTATFIHRLNAGFAKNYSIAWSPMKHESTHLGDEMQIQRMDEGRAIRRVNVSSNYTELVFTLNDPEERYDQNHSFRLGLMLLWDPSNGWYTIKEDAGDGPAALGHKRISPWEAFFQYQYQSPASKAGIQGIASVEIRNRAVYGYDLSLNDPTLDTAPGDSRNFTFNVFAGARFTLRERDGYFSRMLLGLRAYYGNCPYGMFRNLRGYNQFGLCIMFQ
ncbi:MAG: hypothetical protein HUJ98_00115 [Bacteroidaceae bacterium]|nr:hypothetical protein [Bacteroidales bacterium]MCF0184876.1 hypothetical protein [Bacteroidaceae bacterium]